MSDQPLVVARIRGSTDEAPRFTRSATIEELLANVEAHLPVDKVYILQPHPDGNGYSFREAGLIVLDILRDGLQRQVTQPYVPPAPYDHSQDVTNYDKTAMENYTPEGLKERYTPQGIPDQVRPNPTTSEGFVFGQDPEHAIAPKKTQQELLAERGLEVPPETKKKRKRKGKPTPSITEKDLDGPLPHPISQGSMRRVNSISTATQAEAMAASKQIFK